MRKLATIGFTTLLLSFISFSAFSQEMPIGGEIPALELSDYPALLSDAPDNPEGEVILDGTPQNRAGSSVDIYDEWIAVGSFRESPEGTQATTGAVRIFRQSDNGSVEETQKLVPSNLSVTRGFGYFLRFHDGLLYVGAPFGNNNNEFVYVYELNDNGNWTEYDILQSPVDQFNAWFGRTFDMNFGTIAVGTRGNGTYSYFHASVNGQVNFSGEIEIPNYDGNSGYDVALLSTNVYAIVSEEAVHVIQRNQGVSEELYRFDHPEPVADNPYFYRVAASGGMLAIGYPTYNDETGKVVVYQRQYTYDSWNTISELTAPDVSSDNAFGTSLRFEGSNLLVGDVGVNEAYLYKLSPSYSFELSSRFETYRDDGKPLGDNQPALGMSDNRVVIGNTTLSQFIVTGSANDYINGKAYYYEIDSDYPLLTHFESPLRGSTRPPAIHVMRSGPLPAISNMGFLYSGRVESGVVETRVYDNSIDADSYEVVADVHAYPGGLSWVRLDDGEPKIFVSGFQGNSNLPYQASLYRSDTLEELPTNLPEIGGLAEWADLSGNGQLDVIISGREGTPQQASRSTKIFLHQGDLQFEEIVLDEIVNREASSILVADFFNRGHNDIFLIGLNKSDDGLENMYIRNYGDGVFEVEENELSYNGNTYSFDATYGDITNNGYFDIVIGGYATREDNALGIYYNNGDGTFRRSVFWNVFTAANWGSIHVELADLNNNGWLDILHAGISTYSGRAHTLFFYNQGDVAEGEPRFLAEFPDITDVRTGGLTAIDLTDDGKNEVLAYGWDNRGQPIFRAYGNNLAETSYERPGRVENLRFELDEDENFIARWDEATDDITPSGGLTYNVHVSTGDQRDNIVQSMAYDNGFLRTKGPGNAGHRMQFTIPELTDNAENLRVQVSAVNHHGKSSPFSTVIRNAEEQFLHLVNAQTPGSTNNLYPQWVDVNRDGQLNLTLRHRESNDDEFRITPFKLTDGIFRPMESNIEGTYGIWADFYNTGWPDVVSRQPGSGVRLFENREGEFIPADNATSVSITTITPIDHNLNGRTDLAVATGSVLDGTQSRLLINEGDGELTISETTFGRAFNVDAADYNKNGCPDLLFSRFTGVMVYENDCFGNFSVADTLIEYDFDVANAWWADLTANGYPDVVMTVSTDEIGAEEEDLHIMFNQGDGTFEHALTMEAFGLISPIMVDITGNGYLDIVINGDPSSSDDISFLLNIGNGTFEFEEETYMDEYTDGYLAAADVFNRGAADIYAHGRRWEGTNQRWRSGFYRNLLATPYEKSGAPQSLAATIDDVPTFSWSPGEEGTTPNEGLTFNLRVGTTPGGNDVVSSLAMEDGKRLVAKRGNVGSAQSITMYGLELEPNQTYYWSVQSINNIYNGSEFAPEQSFTTGEITSTDPFATIPRSVTLSQNYPNPFNPATAIQFGLPAENHVELAVYDITGRMVARLADSQFSAGYHTISFDASSLASGVYFYRLNTGKSVMTRSMTLIK